MKKIQLRWFQIKIATFRVHKNFQLPTEDLLWDIADNPISSNDLKKLPDIVQSINKRSSKFKKYPLNCSLSKKF